MMGFRGVETQTIFIGNLCLAAGLCMFVSAQWEMARGNTFGYSALSAYGEFDLKKMCISRLTISF